MRQARRAWPILGVLALVGVNADAALARVAIQISSANVQEQGGVGQICVSLSTNGEQVAGTQNDLSWDGACATLPSTSACQAVGSHGKQLQGGFPPQFDFTYRALLLSLSDVDPMPDGPLYCCSFQSEAEPGSCCKINVLRAGASDPKGNAIEVATEGRGQICTAGSSGSRGGSVGGSNIPRAGSASNVGNVPADGGSAPAPAAPAGGAPAAPPAAQVLQGGGAPVPEAVAEAPTVQQPEVPTTVPAQALPPGGLPTRQAPIAPPTQATPAATVAPTAPAPADTATAPPAPTLPPTEKAKAPTAAQAAPAKSEGGGGLFGCQIASTNPTPLAAMGAPLAIAVLAQRWRRRRAERNQPKH